MDWVNIVGVLVFPVVGWLWGKFSNFEAQDGLNKTTSAIWDEIKELRREAQTRDAKIYQLEQKIRNDEKNYR